jgi:hypothetical protein
MAGLSRLRAASLIVFIAIASFAPARAQTRDIAVVVHSGVTVEGLTLADLRRFLLGDREYWGSGERVTLLLRAPVARERDVAIRDVCQMSEAQFRQHWIAKVFRADTAAAPRIVFSAQAALAQVAQTPGALTFVEASAVPPGAKVLKIDGRTPGQSGYPLR